MRQIRLFILPEICIRFALALSSHFSRPLSFIHKTLRPDPFTTIIKFCRKIFKSVKKKLFALLLIRQFPIFFPYYVRC